jgi:hypothetical protein
MSARQFFSSVPLEGAFANITVPAILKRRGAGESFKKNELIFSIAVTDLSLPAISL